MHKIANTLLISLILSSSTLLPMQHAEPKHTEKKDMRGCTNVPDQKQIVLSNTCPSHMQRSSASTSSSSPAISPSEALGALARIGCESQLYRLKAKK